MERTNYEMPTMDIVQLGELDVICASGDTVLPEDSDGF